MPETIPRLFPLESETLLGTARALRAGARTCVEVLEECLARVDQWESRIRAWVTLDREGARAQAQVRDAERARGGWRGPLHGIPIGIKDIIDVAGFPTSAGFSPWHDQIAQTDAPVVARLRQAGAVILGKTVTTQFASFDPPVTLNPWNGQRTPGGSSSGSAAAVACGMCLGALGSQTGGSITRPAAYCGVAGCKPTFGGIRVDGVIPLALSLDHIGCMARTVGDLAVLLEAMASAGTEMASVAPRWEPFAPSRPRPLPRLGWLQGSFRHRAEPAMTRAMDTTIASLRAANAILVDATLPVDADDLLRAQRVLMAVEAAAYHEVRFAEAAPFYFPKIRELIEEGFATRATEYARCRLWLDKIRADTRSWFQGIDAYLLPATPGGAPASITTGTPSFNSQWSFAGLPTINFPIGHDDDGMPLGLQLVGRPWDEPALFRVADWCEAVIRDSSLAPA